MEVYADIVILLNFLVDLLLLLGTNRLYGYPSPVLRTVLAALLGGVYGGACLLPGFAFLGSTLWRVVVLLLMAAVAFGISVSALRRAAVFLLLSMALGGIVSGIGDAGFWGIAAAAFGVLLLCVFGFYTRFAARRFVPVELTYGDRTRRITALWDTGNTLNDPVTGEPVLIVSADVAEAFTGLTKTELKDPVNTIGKFPGLRLIPYRTVGSDGGMLLALRFSKVTIAGRKGSEVVAFAPEGLHREGKYQALAGGL